MEQDDDDDDRERSHPLPERESSPLLDIRGNFVYLVTRIKFKKKTFIHYSGRFDSNLKTRRRP